MYTTCSAVMPRISASRTLARVRLAITTFGNLQKNRDNRKIAKCFSYFPISWYIWSSSLVQVTYSSQSMHCIIRLGDILEGEMVKDLSFKHYYTIPKKNQFLVNIWGMCLFFIWNCHYLYSISENKANRATCRVESEIK